MTSETYRFNITTVKGGAHLIHKEFFHGLIWEVSFLQFLDSFFYSNFLWRFTEISAPISSLHNTSLVELFWPLSSSDTAIWETKTLVIFKSCFGDERIWHIVALYVCWVIYWFHSNIAFSQLQLLVFQPKSMTKKHRSNKSYFSYM